MSKLKLTRWTLYLCTLSLMLGFFATAGAQSSPARRSCTVKEVIDSGGYSYLRCRANNEELWLGTQQVSVAVGSVISFNDVQPMVNFRVKSLHRLFPEIRFVSGISVSAGGAARPEPDNYRPAASDDVHWEPDGSGTLVPHRRPVVRGCIVKEVLDEGGYTYVRCQAKKEEFWVAVMETPLAVGSNIFFPMGEPILNYRSKGLGRTFPLIYFAPGIARSAAEAEGYAGAGFTTREPDQLDQAGSDNVYRGTDDSGALVFTDDPSKVRKPKSNKGKKKLQGAATGFSEPGLPVARYSRPVNRTSMKGFTSAEQKVIKSLEPVLDAYCRGSYKDLRSMSLPEVRPHMDQAYRDAEPATVAEQMQRECYPNFTVTKVRFGKGVSDLNLTYKTATLSFESDPADGGRPAAVMAEFALTDNDWKFVVFSSISS